MELTLKISEKDAQLIQEQLGINLEKGIPEYIKAMVDGLVQLAMLKKAGVKIDMDKLLSTAREMGETAAKKGRKDESAET